MIKKLKEESENVFELKEGTLYPILHGFEEEGHIVDLKQEYINDGMKEEIAEEKAIEKMGNPEAIGKKLNQFHKQKLDLQLIFMDGIKL